jgi:ADP-heptose:LPS heptosyltransferase
MFMPIYRESEEWAESLFNERKLVGRKVVTVHSQASCPSKIWPKDYFKRLIEDITDIYGVDIIYIGSREDKDIEEKNGIINLTGETSISQLASVLKRSSLFISNDSGPVHMAVALGVPVISIFGRKESGLGPRRWGPLGERSIFLHKDIGCEVCLAHDCKRDFACLKAIDPKEVLMYADKFLSK